MKRILLSRAIGVVAGLAYSAIVILVTKPPTASSDVVHFEFVSQGEELGMNSSETRQLAEGASDRAQRHRRNLRVRVE